MRPALLWIATVTSILFVMQGAFAQDSATVREVSSPGTANSSPAGVQYHPDYQALVEELNRLRENMKTAHEVSATSKHQAVSVAEIKLREYINSGKPIIIDVATNYEDQAGAFAGDEKQKADTTENMSRETLKISADQMGFEDVDVSMSPTSNWDNANWGKAPAMLMGGLPDGQSSRRVFIKFDASILDLTEAELVRAELEFDTTFGSGLGHIEVYRVLGPWNAGTGDHTEDVEPMAAPGEITWIRQPSLEEGRVWASAEVSPTPGLVRFDITKLLQAWLSGEHPNYGLALVARSQGEEFYYRGFVSSDNPDEGIRPRLYIERGTDLTGDGLKPGDNIASHGGFVTTSSGLKYQDIVQGSGEEAVPGKTVTVHYTGWLMDGTKFDSSVDRGTPFNFSLGAGMVIKGWDEGVTNMRIGGKRILLIPSKLAYGERGAGQVIPPNSELKFEVELLDME